MMAAKGLTFSTHLVLMEVRMIKPRETFTDTKQVPVQTLYPSEIYFSIRKCLQWDYRLSPRGGRSVGKMGWIGAGVGGRMEGGAVRVGMRGGGEWWENGVDWGGGRWKNGGWGCKSRDEGGGEWWENGVDWGGGRWKNGGWGCKSRDEGGGEWWENGVDWGGG